jgi:hypothetical protein
VPWRWSGVAVGAVAAVLLFVLFVGFTVVKLETARSSLEQARASLTSIGDNPSALAKSDGRAAALIELRSAEAQSATAHGTLTDIPLSGLLTRVPVIGRQLQGAIDLAGDIHTATGLGVTLLNRVAALQDASSGTTVSLTKLAALRSSVESATATLTSLDRPSGGLIAPIGAARASFDHQISKYTTELERGSGVLGYLGVFLGGEGPRSYLLAAENQAEMRDQGSVLSVAQITAIDGHVDANAPTSVSAYTLTEPIDYPIPAGTQAVFGLDRPTQLWQSANLTADFPWTGGDLVGMDKAATGTQDDGVVALDVHALAAILSVSGSVEVAGVSVPVTSSNVTPLLLDTLYQRNPLGPQEQRQDETAAVATAVIKKLSGEHVDLARLARALTGEIASRHLLLYDTDPSQEQTLTSYGASGAVNQSDPTRTFHLAVENATASKLDYFLTTSISQRVIVSNSGTATVITSVAVVNHARAHHAPSEQYGPDGRYAHVPGEYAGIAYLWSPEGSIESGAVSESGLELTARNVDLLPGQETTLIYATIIPKALVGHVLRIHWIPQPAVHVQQLSLTVSGIGTEARAASSARVSLSKDYSGSWTFPR